MRPVARARSAWAAFAVASAATGVALVVQQVVRNAWQVRSLPERTMESLLVLVPLDLFESGLQRFGANAKDIALVGTYVGMALLLIAIGWLAVRSRNGWLALLLGLGLWLLTMLVVLPLTGAGVFGVLLLAPPVFTDAAFGCIFGAYAAVLGLGTGLVIQSDRGEVRGTSAGRRSLLAGLGGTLATLLAFGVARSAAGNGGGVQSSLPLAVAPTASAAPATPTAVRASATAAAAVPTVTAPTAVAPAAVPTAAGFPTPAPVRSVARDQDGSLTAAGRRPGTLAPAITDNQDFYIVTKNAVADPIVDAESWRLIIDGEVDHPVQLDYATLLALPSVEITKTLECISNLTAGCNMASFGCDLISTATWRGVALRDVVDLAGGFKPGVVDVAFLATDEFSAGLPMDVAMDPATLIVFQMNGEVLPREHGYPARLLVPGRYGMKNPKWLAGIRGLNTPFVDWYQQRGWTRTGVVKTMSRIDVPSDGAALMPGSQPVAGIAYAGDRGITMVEVSADGGTTWQPASLLEAPPGKDAMVRWQATFEMRDAPLTLVVRATDGTGVVQPEDFGLPAPDGSWGQDSIDVRPA
ncbi:MAG: molybdopterin-dependent oxidoreductase [Chloroflexi bacterium]|nr:molybdopterin-dependent oxidoreductase [Chloroflexota bacterium]